MDSSEHRDEGVDRSHRVRRMLYLMALPAMPLGLTVWLLGMNLDRYELAVGGLCLTIAGAFGWQDDQHPDHPSRG